MIETVTNKAQKNVPSSLYLLKNLRSSKLELQEPVSVVFEYVNGDVIANCFDLDVYGVGDTEDEALLDLSAIIEEFYFDLREAKNNVSQSLTFIWGFMEKVLKPVHAAQG